MKRINYCILLIALLVVTGCYSNTTLKMYSGSELPESELAVLEIPPAIKLESIDEARGGFLKFTQNVVLKFAGKKRRAILLPGRHTIEMRYCVSLPEVETRHFKTSFQAKRGYRYRISYKALPSIDRKYLRLALFMEESANPNSWRQLDGTYFEDAVSFGFYEYGHKEIENVPEDFVLAESGGHGVVVFSATQTDGYLPTWLYIAPIGVTNQFLPIRGPTFGGGSIACSKVPAFQMCCLRYIENGRELDVEQTFLEKINRRIRLPEGTELGRLVVCSLPAGEYSTIRFNGYMKTYHAGYEAIRTVNIPFCYSFKVIPGRAVYLGNINMRFIAKNRVLKGVRVSVTDKRGRDFRLLREQYPQISPGKIMVNRPTSTTMK